MNRNIIPKNLHHLIPIVEKWGINSVDEMDSLLNKTPIEELKVFVETFTDEDFNCLDEWLCDDGAYTL